MGHATARHLLRVRISQLIMYSINNKPATTGAPILASFKYPGKKENKTLHLKANN